jgi:hypothetical protein
MSVEVAVWCNGLMLVIGVSLIGYGIFGAPADEHGAVLPYLLLGWLFGVIGGLRFGGDLTERQRVTWLARRPDVFLA